MSKKLRAYLESMDLSETQIGIVGCICHGMTDRQTAAHLFRALKSIKWNTNIVFRKFGVGGRRHARCRLILAMAPHMTTADLPEWAGV